MKQILQTLTNEIYLFSNNVLLVKSNTKNNDNNPLVPDIRAKLRPACYGIDINSKKKNKNGMLIDLKLV